MSLCWRILIVPLLQACSRTWLRADTGRDVTYWSDPHPQILYRASHVPLPMEAYPAIRSFRALTIFLDNGHHGVICVVFLVAFSIKSYASLVVHAFMHECELPRNLF